MEELNSVEIEEVGGGRINVRMIAQGGILLLAGSVAVATGGTALVVVGSFAAAAGASWAQMGFQY